MQEKRVINYYLNQYSRMMRKDTKAMIKLLGTDLLGYVRLGEVAVPDVERNFIRNLDKICEEHKIELAALVSIINEVHVGYMVVEGAGSAMQYLKCAHCDSLMAVKDARKVYGERCPVCGQENPFEEILFSDFCKLANIACQPR